MAARFVDLGQQRDVGAGIAACEGPRRGLLAVVAYVAGPAVLGDQPAQLRWGQAGHLAQELPDPALVRPPKAVVVPEPDQRPPDEGVGGVAVRKVEVRRLVTLQEGAELVESPNPFGAKCHDHPPRMSSPLGSCSLLAGNPSPAHACLLVSDPGDREAPALRRPAGRRRGAVVGSFQAWP